jgi:adenosylcobinamide-GDP ribazoletransferase
MFALVGALTGIAGSVPLLGFGAAVLPVGAILAVGAMAIVSGALHLDGLADTGDALVAAGPDAAERARTDPSIGVGGAVALILVTGLEIACLSLLAGGPGPLVAGLACVVGASGSRVAPVVLAIAARPSATAGGLGAWFSDRVTVGDALFAGSSAALLAVVAAVWSGSPGLLVGALVGLGIGTVLGLALVHARGQLDGDGYGATVELTFAVTLVSIALLVRTAGA